MPGHEELLSRIGDGFDIEGVLASVQRRGICAATHAGRKRLFLADTRQLFLVDRDKALARGRSADASRDVKITGGLRGSYATADGKDLWIGTWTEDQRSARTFRLDPRPTPRDRDEPLLAMNTRRGQVFIRPAVQARVRSQP